METVGLRVKASERAFFCVDFGDDNSEFFVTLVGCGCSRGVQLFNRYIEHSGLR